MVDIIESMARKLEFSIDEFYHLYARGNDRKQIFLTERDYLHFLALMYTCNSTTAIQLSNFVIDDFSGFFTLRRGEPLVAIGAYCLMPNHIHFLIREVREKGISQFMQKLLTAYSMYFNKKNTRTGSLFEHPFKAKHVNEDEYLRYLLAYIHLNPVKINDPDGWQGKKILHPESVKQFLDYYRYSSYPNYIGRKRVEDKILNREVFPEYFSGTNDFESYLNDWINFD